MLACEHQLQERCVARGKADVGRRSRPQPRREVLVGAIDRAAQLGAEACETVLGEGVEQRLTIGEVPAWRAVTDADFARELPQ